MIHRLSYFTGLVDTLLEQDRQTMRECLVEIPDTMYREWVKLQMIRIYNARQ